MTVIKTDNRFHAPPNIKWFDKPFDRLTVLSRVEGLTTLSLPVESLKVERVEGQITMIPVSGINRPLLLVKNIVPVASDQR